MGKKNALIMIC